MIEFVESEIAHLGPIMLPKVRHDRPQRPWWEAARLHSMRHYLRKGDYVLDVGAEMGDMSALFASWGCQMFLVEPNPKAWPWIAQTFSANQLEHQVDCWYVGLLGDKDEQGRHGIAGLGIDHAMHGWPDAANLEADPATGFYHLDEHAEVSPVTTVDRLLRETGFSPMAITVDIEGGEIKMIQGMSETLQRHAPIVWMSIHEEFIYDRYGVANGAAVIDHFFEDHEYDSIFLAHDHERHVMFLPKEMGWRW